MWGPPGAGGKGGGTPWRKGYWYWMEMDAMYVHSIGVKLTVLSPFVILPAQ